MAKRYIDTGLFDDDWYMELSKDSKILYLYLITKCSHAGLIKINDRLCKVQTGIGDLKGALEGLRSRFIEVNEGLYFLPKFLFFQYPNFPQSKVYQQKAALDELTKLGLFKDGKLVSQEGLQSPFVDVSVNVDVNANVIADKNVVMPFDSERFIEMWDYWKEYKRREHKFNYKTSISEQAALKEIGELSGGDESAALKIIEQSMAKGWKGFFALDKKNAKSSDMDAYKQDVARRLGL